MPNGCNKDIGTQTGMGSPQNSEVEQTEEQIPKFQAGLQLHILVSQTWA